MPDLGKYAFAVLSSYAVTLGAVAALVLWSIMRDRRVRRTLAALEARRNRKDG
jgi:heme exporter protein D